MATPIRLSEFLSYVLPHAPGCPALVAESYLRMSAIEFCERTRCWRKISEIEIDQERTVAMVAPQYAAIHEIEYASFFSEQTAKVPLIPTQYSDVGERFRAELEGQEGAPQYITQVNPNSVTVFPLMAGTLELSLFLKPRMGQDFQSSTPDDPVSDSFNVVPDFLLTQWGEPIACGALSKLLLQPQTQWYDQQRAGYYLNKFERACDRHFAQGVKGQQRAPARTRYRFL